MVKNPTPNTPFFEKAHKTHFQKKQTHFLGGKKAPQGYPLEIARWARGAGPGPRLNKIGEMWSAYIKYGPT